MVTVLGQKTKQDIGIRSAVGTTLGLTMMTVSVLTFALGFGSLLLGQLGASLGGNAGSSPVNPGGGLGSSFAVSAGPFFHETSDGVAYRATSDTTAPVISITGLTQGSGVKGTVTFTVTVQDESPITELYIRADNNAGQSTIFFNGTGNNASITWDTTTWPDASVSIFVRARDSGNIFGYGGFYVLVNNHDTFDVEVPVIMINQPAPNTVVGQFVTFESVITDNIDIAQGGASANFYDPSGQSTTAYRTIEYTTEKARHVYRFELYTDLLDPGVYTYQVSASDSAGNGATKSISFTIPPKQKPNIKILANQDVHYDDATRASQSGYILLQGERNGEAWYVYPKNKKRYYLGGGEAAVDLMRQLGLGVTNADLNKIPVGGSSQTGDMKVRQRLKGYILLQIQGHGEAWYVYPKDLKRYYLGRAKNAYALMRQLGRGISNATIARIPSATGLQESRTTVQTRFGRLSVTYVSFDRRDASLRLMTDTANTTECTKDCPVKSLAQYVKERGALAGINGTYFCPADYAACANEKGSYKFPVYNSFLNKLLNANRARYTLGGYMVFDTTNLGLMAGASAQPFENGEWYQMRNLGGSGVVRSLFYHQPRIVFNSKDVTREEKLDTKQQTVHATRTFIGLKGNQIYLAVVHGATIPQSAAAATALGMEQALSLDGGGSTALYYNGKYLVGPGRKLPNAILILPQ